MASGSRSTGLTYEALWEFPDDNRIREIIDGELFVTPPPSVRHQQIVGEIFGRLWLYAKEQGGEVLSAPTGVHLSNRDFVEPDVVFLTPSSLGKVEKAFIRSAPDIVVEVSSPSTRGRDLLRKRDLYERSGVPEYWFVDLDSDRIVVHRLSEGGYGQPAVLTRGDTLESPLLLGFSASVDELLGPEV